MVPLTSHTGMDSDSIFWLDPWSAEGQEISAKILPIAEELRTHAEQAIVLIEAARAVKSAFEGSGRAECNGFRSAAARFDWLEV